MATDFAVQDQDPRIQYSATNGQVNFDFPYPFYVETDVIVYLTPAGNAADDAADLLMLTADYAVTGGGTESAGLVTLTAGANAGDIITLVRQLTYDREVDYQTSGDLLAQTLNEEQDRDVLRDQELRSDISRSLRIQETDTGEVSLTFPAYDAGKYIAWDSPEKQLTNATIAQYAVPPNAAFSTVAAMLAVELDAGQLVATQGYHSINDGGQAFYTIKTAVDYGGTPDEFGDHTLANGNIAELLTSGAINVAQFGGVGDGVTDDSLSVGAAIDVVKTSYDSTSNNFRKYLDFNGLNYLCTQSINITGIRQPGVKLVNGGIISAAVNKIAVDFAGTNSPILIDFRVWGDKNNMPGVGIYFGRDGTLQPASSAKFSRCRVEGYFAMASVINFASEVSSSVQCYYVNKNPDPFSYVYVNTATMDTLVTYFAGLTSDFTALPAVGTVSSNILHSFNQCEILHSHNFHAASITNITQALDAVVTMSAGDMVTMAAEMSVGDFVVFHGVGGMDELNTGYYEILGMGATSFTIDVDSTGFSPYTSGGSVRNRTGKALLLNGTGNIKLDNTSYLLTYGAAPVEIDLSNSARIKNCELSFQAESNPPTLVNMRLGADDVVIQGFTMQALNSSQTISESIIYHYLGTGTVRIDNADINIVSQGSAPANGVFYPASVFSLRNAYIRTFLQASLNLPVDFAHFTGVQYAAAEDFYEENH